MTHTPGPYHITRNDDRVWIEARVGGGIARLAIIDDGAGTQPGNAELFAAAPDMLVALKRIRDYLYERDILYMRMEVEAAIAKAEGRTT